jgi:transposase
MQICPECNSKHLYTLRNGYMKCSYCKKKYSLKKLQSNENVVQAFCQNITARQCHINLKLNYITVQNKYKKLRQFIVHYLDEQYTLKKQCSNEYDEYIYLKSKDIFEAQNFLTFIYENKIYNLMLPSLYKFKTYQESKKELSKFLFLNKIAKLQSKTSLITDFWSFLEEFLKKYKGVESANFIYYLKEAEFKFNYTQEEQIAILSDVLNL